jgi:hypothetical protein
LLLLALHFKLNFMKQFTLFAAALFFFMHAGAQQPEEISLFFKNIKTKLSQTEKKEIYSQLGLSLSKDKKQFISAEYPVEVMIYPTDLNKDGTEELFVGLGSTALFGYTGEQYSLFIKNAQGHYKAQENIGGGKPFVLAAKNGGYPQLLIGGPGFKFPVYAWNGRQYSLLKTISDAQLQKMKATELDMESKTYAASL